MKKIYLLLIAVTLGVGSFAQAPVCDSTLWQHVYWPGRLPVLQTCVSITGKVGTLLSPTLTQDGDYHIYILPDTQYDWMIHFNNPANWNNDGVFPGYLNVEEVCAATPVDTYALAACHNFTNSAYVPNTGEYVRVTAPFCYDTFHHWNEMHPVTSMEVIATGVIDESNTFLNDLKVFPQPAGHELNLQFGFAPHLATYIRIFNSMGREIGDYVMAETTVLTLNTDQWPAGEYFYSISQDKDPSANVNSSNQSGNLYIPAQGKILKSGKFVIVH